MKTKKTIEKILTTYPKTRDNDTLLYSYYLREKGYSIYAPYSEIIRLIELKLIRSQSQVERIRRRIQEIRIELRGKNYEKRQMKAGRIRMNQDELFD
jgi:hypothetical protein